MSGAFCRDRYLVQGPRKSRTFYFNALDAKLFDVMADPVVTEPVVQLAL